MAEERDVALERVSDAAGDEEVDQTKAALQRRMEEARESISQTVTEIKETVVNQYQQVRETISDTLDWREQYRRHTLPFTIGAFAVGALVGYGVMSAFKGDGDGYDEEGEDSFDRIDRGFDQMGAARSYAAAPILGEHQAATAYQRTSAPGGGARAEGEGSFAGQGGAGPAPRPSYSSGYQAPTAPQHPAASAGEAEEEEEEKGPSL